MQAYDLDRFLSKQAVFYPIALAELRAGRKRSHWMWFIFPQLKGLGRSTLSHYYGLSGLPEARAYIAEPTLRAHLLEAVRVLLSLDTCDPCAILGDVDALKLCSSMTLFSHICPDIPEFSALLDKFYAGHRDPATLSMV